MEVWSFVNGNWREGDLAFADQRWFDLADDAAELHSLAERFGLHPLAVEDCLSPLMHAPKIDEFPDYLFIVFQAALPNLSEDHAMEEVDVFLGHNFVITYQDRALAEMGQVRSVLRQGITVRPGVDGILYEVIDRLVDSTLPVVERIGGELDEIHQAVLDSPGGRIPSHDIVTLRSQAGRIRRVLTPEMTVAQRLSRGEFNVISEANRVYYRDIYDHLVRIDLALENVREDAEVVLSTYLSSLNNRMSEVMKVITVVAALALPATVITGVFGTNFDNVPGLHSNWGFALMVGAIVGVGGTMALYFHRRGWI
ncbi:MAG: magnesium transporter CorA family protein [Chloroflexi bacterium]|nr:magnesium transporter CorA family protein [Chloroflexota bacterium]